VNRDQVPECPRMSRPTMGPTPCQVDQRGSLTRVTAKSGRPLMALMSRRWRSDFATTRTAWSFAFGHDSVIDAQFEDGLGIVRRSSWPKVRLGQAGESGVERHTAWVRPGRSGIADGQHAMNLRRGLGRDVAELRPRSSAAMAVLPALRWDRLFSPLGPSSSPRTRATTNRGYFDKTRLLLAKRPPCVGQQIAQPPADIDRRRRCGNCAPNPRSRSHDSLSLAL